MQTTTVIMTKPRSLSIDGIRITDARKGDTLKLPTDLADHYLSTGVAKLPRTKRKPMAPEVDVEDEG